MLLVHYLFVLLLLYLSGKIFKKDNIMKRNTYIALLIIPFLSLGIILPSPLYDYPYLYGFLICIYIPILHAFRLRYFMSWKDVFKTIFNPFKHDSYSKIFRKP